MILIFSVGFFLYFFNHITNVDSDIKNCAEIINLNSKKLFSIYPDSDKTATTDFYLDEEQKNDTVFYTCRFEET